MATLFFIFFQIWHYCELSNSSDESNYSTPYIMTHNAGNESDQFGICKEGPFKTIKFSSLPECSE